MLRHIAQARNYMHQRNDKAATEQLQEATALLATLNRALPTSVTKGQIAASKKQLEQDRTTDPVRR